MRLQLRRDIAKGLDGLSNPVYHSNRIRVAALLLNGNVDGLLAVHTDDVVLHVGTIDGVAYIGDENRLLTLGF